MGKVLRNSDDLLKNSFTYSSRDEATDKYFQMCKPMGTYVTESVTEDKTLPSGEAGTTFIIGVNATIANEDGFLVGYFHDATANDSSLSLSGTAVTTQKRFFMSDSEEKLFDSLENGEFAFDYHNGIMYGKKADSSTTITLTYTRLIQKVDTELSVEEVTISNIDVYATASGTVKKGLVDSNGRVITQESSVTDWTEKDLTYDTNGNVATITIKSGATILATFTYTYDVNGNISSIVRS